MPSRNIIRTDISDGYYHVYARGGSKQSIFIDDQDKHRFIALLDRYLGESKNLRSSTGFMYPNYSESVNLLAYCLMDNHFHLFVHQLEAESLKKFMQGMMTSYVTYFNRRHERSGSLFESRYKASIVDDEAYFTHISRYIHLNRKHWKYYRYSSINYYRKGGEPSWLKTEQVLSEFSSRAAYIQFVEDYEGYKAILDEISYDLADK